jgi:hypothetical protein
VTTVPVEDVFVDDLVVLGRSIHTDNGMVS